jgi:hypothetical protein
MNMGSMIEGKRVRNGTRAGGGAGATALVGSGGKGGTSSASADIAMRNGKEFRFHFLPPVRFVKPVSS